MELVVLGIGFAINLATIMMHVSVVSSMLPWVRLHAAASDGDATRVRATLVIGLSICGLLTLQLISAVAWALTFRAVLLAPNFAGAFNLSLKTISALGGDEAGLRSQWGALLPLSSINGALLFGLSTAVMFRLVTLFQATPRPEPGRLIAFKRAKRADGADAGGDPGKLKSAEYPGSQGSCTLEAAQPSSHRNLLR